MKLNELDLNKLATFLAGATQQRAGELVRAFATYFQAINIANFTAIEVIYLIKM